MTAIDRKASRALIAEARDFRDRLIAMGDSVPDGSILEKWLRMADALESLLSPIPDEQLDAIEERWRDEQNRPGGTIARDTILALLAEVRRLLALSAHPAEEWEYAWEADEAVRATLSPRGPKIMIEGVAFTPEEIAAFPRGRRVRRRPAGPWGPVPSTEGSAT